MNNQKSEQSLLTQAYALQKTLYINLSPSILVGDFSLPFEVNLKVTFSGTINGRIISREKRRIL